MRVLEKLPKHPCVATLKMYNSLWYASPRAPLLIRTWQWENSSLEKNKTIETKSQQQHSLLCAQFIPMTQMPRLIETSVLIWIRQRGFLTPFIWLEDWSAKILAHLFLLTRTPAWTKLNSAAPCPATYKPWGQAQPRFDKEIDYRSNEVEWMIWAAGQMYSTPVWQNCTIITNSQFFQNSLSQSYLPNSCPTFSEQNLKKNI